MDGKSFAGELHLVFANGRFSSLADAMQDPEGLCVLGVFLKVTATCTVDPRLKILALSGLILTPFLN